MSLRPDSKSGVKGRNIKKGRSQRGGSRVGCLRRSGRACPGEAAVARQRAGIAVVRDQQAVDSLFQPWYL